jgi:CMP-N-acetylneuraminic acid synthetase
LKKENLNILGIIPARGGSKEVKRKNLLKIGDKTLIEIALDSVKGSARLNRTIFSTDDDEMYNLAKSLGADIPFKRPGELAKDDSSIFSVVKHAVNWLDEIENWKADIIVLLQPTTPFRTSKHIDDVISLLLKTQADAAITVKKPDYPPQWMLQFTKDKKLENIIPGGNTYLRRQDTPSSYQPAGLVFAFTKQLLNSMNTVLPSGDTRGVIVSEKEGINIDTWEHYEMAKLFYDEKI